MIKVFSTISVRNNYTNFIFPSINLSFQVIDTILFFGPHSSLSISSNHKGKSSTELAIFSNALTFLSSNKGSKFPPLAEILASSTFAAFFCHNFKF